jgi:hypothetical protein
VKKTMKTMHDENRKTAEPEMTKARSNETAKQVMTNSTTPALTTSERAPGTSADDNREKENEVNTNDPMATTSLTPMTVDHANDGFFDCDESEGFAPILIAGTRIKFTNASEWFAGDELIPPDREFIIVKIVRAVQKWLPGCRGPEPPRILGENEPFPNVKAMNAAAPKEEWHESFGQLKGPYENVFAVYLCDPDTYDGFTFPTATVGGHKACREIKASGRRAKQMHGLNYYPRVTLGHTWMPTGYGGRERPQFKIRGHEPFFSIAADQAPQLEAPQRPEAQGQAAPKPTDAQDHAAKGTKQPPKDDDLNDEIIF